MFTGLVQTIGRINLFGKGVLVEAPDSFLPLSLGESISVEGVCLTVTALKNRAFLADVSEETLGRTILGEKAISKGFVNLEKALKFNDRLGGHLVSGHVDGLGKVLSIESLPNSRNLQILWKDTVFSKYTCDKASIALNGVSLTISEIKKQGEIFSIAVIPHTWAHTSLQYLVEGELVNLESDLIAKYAESLLRDRTNGSDSINNFKTKSEKISENWLKRNGYE